MNGRFCLFLALLFPPIVAAASSLDVQIADALRALNDIERIVRSVNTHDPATPIAERHLLQEVIPEQLSYLQTVRAALVIARRDATLTNLFNASTAMTGFEYDMKSLVILLSAAYAREKVGTGNTGQSHKELRIALSRFSEVADIISATVASRMMAADRRLNRAGG